MSFTQEKIKMPPPIYIAEVSDYEKLISALK